MLKVVLEMNISAIIAEYNPLHNGHVYHINKTKEIANSDAIICIMSGNYVQRGIPSIIDKWNRTKAALECGVDLVIELPVVYSLSSAEFFAFGAVSLLNSIGVTSSICFGSEAGDIELIREIAKVLVEEPADYKSSLKVFLNKGYTYPSARSKALLQFFESNSKINNINLEEALNSSNNILGIEYMKSLIRLNSTIKPYTIKREGGSYNSTQLDKVYSSATSIRKFLKEDLDSSLLKNHMPEHSYSLIEELSKKDYNYVFEDSLFPYLKYKCLTQGSSLTNLPDVAEGLENKILKNIGISKGFDDIVERIKSKRYTYTRLSRILCQYFVGFELFNTRELRTAPCPYARVLGFNNKGTSILKKMKVTSNIPVYTKIPKVQEEVLSLDILATRSYSIINDFVSPEDDFLISPICLL